MILKIRKARGGSVFEPHFPFEKAYLLMQSFSFVLAQAGVGQSAAHTGQHHFEAIISAGVTLH